jgi:phosphatidylglycerol---prolipoprotein diacylglyceryl transferase
MKSWLTHGIDPVMFRIGVLEVRWYGFMYLLGFVIAAGIVHAELKRKGGPLPTGDGPILLLYAFLALTVGGRLGYVLIYNLQYYVNRPQEILAVRRGGLSFHGGLLGMIITGLFVARARGVPFMALADLGAIASPIGIMLVKIGNFINGELFGRLTDLPWGVIFPAGGPFPRHPSQLYEAALEGPVLFAVLWKFRMRAEIPGEILAAFLIGYGSFRFFAEFFREPDPQIGFLWGWLTMGQLLCSFMVVGGMGLFVRVRRGR